jgi:hypothetical protein
MQEYADGVNVDRLVSFAALVSFMKIQQSNRGYLKRQLWMIVPKTCKSQKICLN